MNVYNYYISEKLLPMLQKYPDTISNVLASIFISISVMDILSKGATVLMLCAGATSAICGAYVAVRRAKDYDNQSKSE